MIHSYKDISGPDIFGNLYFFSWRKNFKGFTDDAISSFDAMLSLVNRINWLLGCSPYERPAFTEFAD